MLGSNEKNKKKKLLSRIGCLLVRFLYSSFLLPRKSKENRLKYDWDIKQNNIIVYCWPPGPYPVPTALLCILLWNSSRSMTCVEWRNRTYQPLGDKTNFQSNLSHGVLNIYNFVINHNYQQVKEKKLLNLTSKLRPSSFVQIAPFYFYWKRQFQLFPSFRNIFYLSSYILNVSWIRSPFLWTIKSKKTYPNHVFTFI